MRFLILFILATLFGGCGVVRNIAIQTCSNGSYNVAACPGILDRMVPKAPAVETPLKRELKCEVNIKTWRRKGMVLQESTKTCARMK